MFSKPASLLALAGLAFAQNTPDLATALNSTPDLSTLSTILNGSQALLQSLAGATDITILAPSNEAFAALGNETLSSLAANPGLITAILQYHVLNGTIRAADITNMSAFAPTLLTNPLFTNVTGGQVVEAVKSGDNVTIYSGLLANSSVTTADVNVTNGVVHIIDRVLTLPEDAGSTLLAAGLTSLRGALVNASLVEAVNTTPNLTIFAPNNEAFQNIGSALPNLTAEQLTDILTYHVVPSTGGPIGYSSNLENGTTLTSLQGESITITIGEGGVFANGARVVIADVLIANGVVHVIDEVLNPTNQTVVDGSGDEGTPAFEGASSVSDAPFTSGQPTPTTTISPEATEAADPTQSPSGASSAGASGPMKTGAVGMGALFGAAAVYLM